jgi:thiol:disulfide interchange protein DsbD
VDVQQYSGEVSFVQAVQMKGRAKTNLSGKITYMLCDAKECLPPKTIPFSILIK